MAFIIRPCASPDMPAPMAVMLPEFAAMAPAFSCMPLFAAMAFIIRPCASPDMPPGGGAPSAPSAPFCWYCALGSLGSTGAAPAAAALGSALGSAAPPVLLATHPEIWFVSPENIDMVLLLLCSCHPTPQSHKVSLVTIWSKKGFCVDMVVGRTQSPGAKNTNQHNSKLSHKKVRRPIDS